MRACNGINPRGMFDGDFATFVVQIYFTIMNSALKLPSALARLKTKLSCL